VTVEPFTVKGRLVIFVSVVARHQPRVRGVFVVFGGGLHDPLLNSRIFHAPFDCDAGFPNWRDIPISNNVGGVKAVPYS
jgi:hypothetical protein